MRYFIGARERTSAISEHQTESRAHAAQVDAIGRAL